MKRILLILPEYKVEHGPWELYNHPYIGKKALVTPLPLATLAALTPDDIEVELWDEKVQGLIDEEIGFDKKYDLIGISSLVVHLRRAKAIARIFRKRGVPVAVGGPGVTVAPVLYRDDFDILLIGEGELIWPRFVTDFFSGDYSKEYREPAHLDMGISPPPRWDSIVPLMKDNYYMGGVQTMRGCPFSCEFCNIWKLYGRHVRLKPIDRVLDEIIALERIGMERILFCVDNFAGNPGYAKELLRKLIILNRQFPKPLNFSTEISLNIAHDEEMLSLLAEANFFELLIGIESPNKESLKAYNKVQNLNGDLITNCLKIMSYGLPIDGSMIVGFDQDTPEIFDQQFEFLQKACIPAPKMHLLAAIPGTDMYNRLIKERRVIDLNGFYKSKGIYNDLLFITNIIPIKMTRAQLFSDYIRLLERIYDPDNFASRVMGLVSNVSVRGKSNLNERAEFSNGLPAALDAFIGSLDEKTQCTILKILSHTRRHAPFMISRIIPFIIRRQIGLSYLSSRRKLALKQIDLEESHDIKQFLQEPG